MCFGNFAPQIGNWYLKGYMYREVDVNGYLQSTYSYRIPNDISKYLLSYICGAFVIRKKER